MTDEFTPSKYTPYFPFVSERFLIRTPVHRDAPTVANPLVELSPGDIRMVEFESTPINVKKAVSIYRYSLNVPESIKTESPGDADISAFVIVKNGAVEVPDCALLPTADVYTSPEVEVSLTYHIAQTPCGINIKNEYINVTICTEINSARTGVLSLLLCIVESSKNVFK